MKEHDTIVPGECSHSTPHVLHMLGWEHVGAASLAIEKINSTTLPCISKLYDAIMGFVISLLESLGAAWVAKQKDEVHQCIFICVSINVCGRGTIPTSFTRWSLSLDSKLKPLWEAFKLTKHSCVERCIP